MVLQPAFPTGDYYCCLEMQLSNTHETPNHYFRYTYSSVSVYFRKLAALSRCILHKSRICATSLELTYVLRTKYFSTGPTGPLSSSSSGWNTSGGYGTVVIWYCCLYMHLLLCSAGVNGKIAASPTFLLPRMPSNVTRQYLGRRAAQQGPCGSCLPTRPHLRLTNGPKK